MPTVKTCWAKLADNTRWGHQRAPSRPFMQPSSPLFRFIPLSFIFFYSSFFLTVFVITSPFTSFVLLVLFLLPDPPSSFSPPAAVGRHMFLCFFAFRFCECQLVVDLHFVFKFSVSLPTRSVSSSLSSVVSKRCPAFTDWSALCPDERHMDTFVNRQHV